MIRKPQRIKIPGQSEIVDLAAVFDNETADAGEPVTLSAPGLELAGLERAADGVIQWKMGKPLIVGIIVDGKLI